MEDKNKKFKNDEGLIRAYNILSQDFVKPGKLIDILKDGQNAEFLDTTPITILKKLMNRDEFLLHTNDQGCMFYVDFVAWLNEIAKELGIEIGETK